jgi:uncharacterized radical SAM superfamily Fe-S cluster-containing enzyme
MKNSRVVLSAMFVAIFAGVPSQVHARQAPPPVPTPHHVEEGVAAAPGASTSEGCQHKMGMMSEMNAADAKLDELVQTMNAAKGAEKVDAIAAVVTALVKEQAAMRASMAMKMKMMSMADKMSVIGDTATGKPKP